MTPEVTAGFAICFTAIAGLSVWTWRLNARVVKLSRDLDNIAKLTRANTLFIDGVKTTASKMREASSNRIAELQHRTPR